MSRMGSARATSTRLCPASSISAARLPFKTHPMRSRPMRVTWPHGQFREWSQRAAIPKSSRSLELLGGEASGKGRSPCGGDELATRLGVRPAQRVLHMLVRGRLASVEHAPDLAIGGSLRNEIHDLILSRREVRLAIPRPGTDSETRSSLE